MKRLSLIGSWKRIGVQAGLLAGIGLAFVGGTQPPTLQAEPPENCKSEDMCSFKKPLFLIILDYSTSMNKDFMGQGTRWENAVSATKTALTANNGFLVSNFIIGLERFGHDPNPQMMGTPIPNDNSGIIDGQILDVGFYDPADPAKKYAECEQGDVISAALDALPPPINGNLTGIGTWTRGSLLFAEKVFDQALVDHPTDDDPPAPRLRSIMLVTDGEWTNPQGNTPLAPPAENPAPQAANLFMNDGIPTYVVAIGEAMGKMFADELAAAGGTGVAYDAANPDALVAALQMVVQDLIEAQVSPICTPGLPRIMVLLDASSSMLNLQGGAVHAPMGQGGWEQARDALAADMGSIFETMVANGNVEDLVHLGLAVFGGNMPDESDILVQYGPCRRDNFKWALDPQSSCVAPGCNDPYAPAPITWTYQDGSMVPPNFDDQTLSHMPLCNQGQAPNMGCFGSGTFTHLGLLTIQNNITAYKTQCMAMNAQYPCDNNTQFINILITDGISNSTNQQVQMPLQQMYMQGITTYVIGLGDGVDTPAAIAHLNLLADAGSGNMNDYYDANNQMQLEAALADIIEGVSFDPCCKFNDCAEINEPTTIEPDPVPEPDVQMTTGTTTDTSGTTDMTTDISTSSSSVGPTTQEPDPTATVASTQEPDPTATVASTQEPDPTATEPNPTSLPTGTDDSGPSTLPTTTQEPDPSPEPDASSGGSETGVTTGELSEEGCGCKTDDAPRGLLGTLLTFGLAGFIRRRRRQ